MHSQNKKRLAIPTIKVRIKVFELKKVHFSTWLTPQLKQSCWERGQWKLVKDALILFQKIDLLFEHWNPGPNRPILRDIRGQNILPVIYTIKRDLTFNHHNHENGSTIDDFLNFWVQIWIIGRNGIGKDCGRKLFWF